MISRLTTAAALFAVLATATLAYAVERPVARSAALAPAGDMPVIVLPRVEVIGHNLR